jgi:hypothetical protein
MWQLTRQELGPWRDCSGTALPYCTLAQDLAGVAQNMGLLVMILAAVGRK